MRPLHLQVGRLRIAGHIFLACNIRAVVDVDITAETVALDVARLGIDCPCTAGVYVACYLQVHIVAQRKVVTYAAQI